LGPLVIQPAGTARVDFNRDMLVFIQNMPATKLVNRISLGDIAYTDDCVSTLPQLKLSVREHPAGAIGLWTTTTVWEGNAPLIAANHNYEPRTWNTEPITFVKGRGYSFWVEGQSSSCSVFKTRSWPHNQSQVNPGTNRCETVTSNRYRMWHEVGQSDAVPCPNSGQVANLDPSMPTGWLSLSSPSLSSYIEVISESNGTSSPGSCTGRDMGALKTFWRATPGMTNWSDYVCVRRFRASTRSGAIPATGMWT
jgi:hypothetical protein